MAVTKKQFPHGPCTYLKSVGVKNDKNAFQAQSINLKRVGGKKVMLQRYQPGGSRNSSRVKAADSRRSRHGESGG